MGKKKQIAIAESNLCNFGTDLEKEIKKAAAECEAAWNGVGTAGLRIWRIEKFKVVPWPTEQLGKFYDGDSYIVLHSYTRSANSPMVHDVHFWLGENTTQDEAGTAAYKTVELDDKLGGVPVQHREVQNHESELFLQYFPEGIIEILKGGIESGFNHVEEKTYAPRLLHVKGTRQSIRVNQVKLARKSLNSGDVFILDLGMEIIQWNGSKASLFEKMRAGQVVRAMRDERGAKPEAFIYSEGDKDSGLARFWDALGGEGKIKDAASGGSDVDAAAEAQDQVKLYRLSDKKKKMKFTLEKTGNLSKSDLDTNDAFVLDNGAEIFVWIGKKASPDERRLAMQYAQNYLTENARPAYLPISRIIEGSENAVFDLNFGGGELSRDLDFSAPVGPPSCCPHFPGGTSSNKWAQVQNPADRGGLDFAALPSYAKLAIGGSGGSGGFAQKLAMFGGGAAATSSSGASSGGADPVQQVATQVFSVFSNKFHF